MRPWPIHAFWLVPTSDLWEERHIDDVNRNNTSLFIIKSKEILFFRESVQIPKYVRSQKTLKCVERHFLNRHTATWNLFVQSTKNTLCVRYSSFSGAISFKMLIAGFSISRFIGCCYANAMLMRYEYKTCPVILRHAVSRVEAKQRQSHWWKRLQ